MARNCEPAIMLHRPYPLTSAHKGHSYLGGTPKLPQSLEWPRTSSGVPLHFLAQIYCAELPSSQGLLPDSGLLFFFAKIDEDMDWDNEPLHDACRVLFVPDAAETSTPAPSDLPKIQGGWSAFEKNFVLPSDPVYCSYPKWPVGFFSIDSWPDASAFPGHHYLDNPFREYQTAIDQARSAEADRATGLPPLPEKVSYVDSSQLMDVGPKDKDSDTLPAAAFDPPFPQLWLMIDRVARIVATWSAESARRVRDADDALIAAYNTLRQDAVRWAAVAKAAGLLTQPDAGQQRRFTDWMRALRHHDHRQIGTNVGSLYAKGLISAIQYIAQRPDLTAYIPKFYLQAYAKEFLPNRYQRSPGYPNRVSHQMLGNAHSAQQANPVDREEVLLLQLISDPGVNFMFCDMGEAEFWINKDDLANRHFDRVRATTCGG
ncbi:DUF1963 domain-containing protein [Pelagibius sp. Alg239-R121]|uniref:DUF1963 domain-containing protein n=1 Tax=Pelagibius sp. Alg239-R121 TaxID=2993448 RepID=UPI0024A71CB4|nr:DUF1963 domain-containing protein [Pelagibius sp. Alg239-R121]